MKRVILLSVLAAVILGLVFLRCAADKFDVDGPLRWRTACEIPVNLTMPVDTAVYDEILKLVNAEIVRGVNLPPAQKDELAAIIGGADTLISKIMDPDFEDELKAFMNGKDIEDFFKNPAVKKYLEDENLTKDDITKEIMGKADSIKKDEIDEMSILFPLGTETIPALDGLEFLNKVDDPDVRHRLELFNETPFGLTCYVLFFEAQNKNYIERMPDSVFLDFVKERKYRYQSGYIDFFAHVGDDLTGLRIGRDSLAVAPQLSESMRALLREFIIGKNSLAWRWIAEIDAGQTDAVLKALGEKKRYDINAKLSIKVYGTNNLDSLFRW